MPITCKISLVDILLLCCITIGGLSQFIIYPQAINQLMLAQWGVLIISYIFIRQLRNKNWILWTIILIGVLEASLGILQKIHWLDSRHLVFDITGTFANPGPLGGFLAIVVVIAWGMYRVYSMGRVTKLLLLTIILLTGTTLILADSRAGWIAAISGCVCIGFFGTGGFRFPPFAYIVITLLIGCLLTGVYFYKKDSADGRLLIWKVSINMIADAPLVGHGIGSFPQKYMYYQAQYFKENPDSKLKNLADNIIYPYNEFLRIGVEVGITGMLAALLLIIVAFRYASPQKENNLCRAAFMSLLVFALFSYPANVFLLLILFPLLLGGIICDRGIVLSVSSIYKYVCWGICAICLCMAGSVFYKYLSLESKVNQLYMNSTIGKHVDSKRYGSIDVDELKQTPQLLDLYAQYSFQHLPAVESLPIVQLAATMVPTSEVFCDLGDLYLQQKRTEKAIECYRLSSDMIPHRILPRYKLFQLYYDVGDTVRMRKIGELLLLLPVKVESTQTLRIKGETKRLLLGSFAD